MNVQYSDGFLIRQYFFEKYLHIRIFYALQCFCLWFEERSEFRVQGYLETGEGLWARQNGQRNYLLQNGMCRVGTNSLRTPSVTCECHQSGRGCSLGKKMIANQSFIAIWWRWRVSNPRPPILCLKIYMLRLLYLVNPARPESQGV